eukprot:314465_1
MTNQHTTTSIPFTLIIHPINMCHRHSSSLVKPTVEPSFMINPRKEFCGVSITMHWFGVFLKIWFVLIGFTMYVYQEEEMMKPMTLLFGVSNITIPFQLLSIVAVVIYKWVRCFNGQNQERLLSRESPITRE